MKTPPEKQADQVEQEDIALFRNAIGSIKPIADPNRVVLDKTPRKPSFNNHAPAQEVPDILSDFVSGDTPSEFLSNGLSATTLRKLRRGTWLVRDSLDLHGFNTDTARKLLQEFLHDALQRKLRCVLVIHGKGMNSSGGEAILKKLTRNWLVQHQAVLGFCDANPNQGGNGAVLVLLRSSR